MKKLLLVALCVIIALCSLSVISCGNPCNHTWNEGAITTKATKLKDGTITYTCSLCEETKNESYKLVAPTAAQTYLARQKVVNENVEGYDFAFSLGANLEILGLAPSVSGNYSGKYRNNKSTNQETFLRKTSGALFFDSSALSYSSGNSKIRLDADENGIIEKAAVLSNDDKDFFINKTIVSLVNAIHESHLSTPRIDDLSTPYDFVSTLNFGANSSLLNDITSLLGKFGTKIAFKEVKFTNPLAIPIHFNIDDDGRLNDFEIDLDVQIKVKLADVNVFIKYKQNDSSTPISIPDVAGISVDKSKIQSDLNAINAAISTVKNSKTYSLDLVARNEFDPAWNKLATVDKYTARLYKNTVEDDVWFNHSYVYKAHHEEDGKESYKYTLGNIADGTTHLVSRKGSNVITPVSGYSANTQFDFLVNPFLFSADNIDCVSSATSGDTKVYTIHLNSQAALSVQQKILNIINSNDAEGVVDVNNYLNQYVDVKGASFKVTVVDGALSKMEIETDLKYNPIGGDYTDYNITLTNNLELLVNKNLSAAQDYVAPSKAASTLGIGGLKDIL